MVQKHDTGKRRRGGDDAGFLGQHGGKRDEAMTRYGQEFLGRRSRGQEDETIMMSDPRKVLQLLGSLK